MTTLFDQLDPRRVHRHSRKAYHEELRNLNKRALAIYCNVRDFGRGTDRQIRDRLGLPDMNNVRPRITELVDAGLLREVDSVVCSVTGKTVRIVDMAGGDA